MLAMKKLSIGLRPAMIHCFLYLSFFLHLWIMNALTVNSPYTPTDHVLLNCGSRSKLNASDGQSWDGDVGTKFSPDINKADISFPVTAAEQDPSINGPVPYMTARIFLSRFSYSFPVSRGQKILRLYFFPANYLKTQSFFSVTGNQYSLLSNFSAYLVADAQLPKSASLVKEFIINVNQIQILNVTFVPAANSYAFVNGIEVVSIPDNLYLGSQNFTLVNADRFIYTMKSYLSGQLPKLFDNTTALETLYRLNVGGQAISAVDDSGMFRQWLEDEVFLHSDIMGNPLSNWTISLQYTSQTLNYTAPSPVYTTARAMGFMAQDYNLTWKFQVDSGFYYLLRLHFCEFMPYFINATKQRVFTILIDDLIAKRDADIIRWTGGTGIPTFRDLVMLVPNSSHNSQSKQDLLLALRPDFADKPMYYDAILNGLEIFKLNTTAGSLAGPNPELTHSSVLNTNPLKQNKTPSEKSQSKGHIRMIVSAVGGVVGGGIIILVLYILLIYRRRELTKWFERKSSATPSRSTTTKKRKVEAEMILLRDEYIHNLIASDEMQNQRREGDLNLFNFASLVTATNNFSGENKLGEGGFGPVYRGRLLDGQEIAVKRLSRASGQGLVEFKNELRLISQLQHDNLVRVLGCCIHEEEKMLIYEFMPNKSLDFFLFAKDKREKLYWQERFSIIEGIAQGMLYLHKYSRMRVIHRDLKTSNVLLNEHMKPKIADFGMARIFEPNETEAMTNRVVGTYGYMSPEYAMEGTFSIKSDVFSFGVLILEVVSGRRNSSFYDFKEYSLNLIGYAWELWKEGVALELKDPTLGDSSDDKKQILRSIHIGLLCVQESATDRPTMSEVISMLSNESMSLADPKQPAFFNGRRELDNNHGSNSTEVGNQRTSQVSVNECSLSITEPR